MRKPRSQIPEDHYRASRVCRVLGNPTAYEAIILLLEGPKTPTKLADRLGVSLATISSMLRSLRQIDLVRYLVENNGRSYWIKHKKIKDLTRILNQLIRSIRKSTDQIPDP